MKNICMLRAPVIKMNKAMNSLFDVVGFWDHFGSPVCTVHQEQEQISTDQ